MQRWPPSQEAYASLVPSIRLFLSNNLLRTVPGEVFRLQNISVLSLRNNQLTELPSGIASLVNMEELNVAGNELRWLPRPILDLLHPKGKLKTLSVHPNPFAQPLLSAELSEEIANELAPVRGCVVLPAEPRHLLSTRVLYLNVDGARHRGSASSSQDDPWTASIPASRPTVQDAHQALPVQAPAPTGASLVEMALRSCSKLSYLDQLEECLPSDCAESLPRLLRQAQVSKESGGQHCSVCRRQFIVARTEWIEWYDQVARHEHLSAPRGSSRRDLVPLIHRGCSWNCVPSHAHPAAER